jgi:hypothetical protein
MEERLNQELPVASTKLIVGLFFTILGLLWTADNLALRGVGAPRSFAGGGLRDGA